ncbi:MAG: hypothetical protein JRE45_17410 [Deltaproteobacteria bacterium]|nr:hypothetical protein [Deltaproteobacteria bacterium]MBW2629376.1 hypothetical protein [Deltaproteobacteria bacterium]
MHDDDVAASSEAAGFAASAGSSSAKLTLPQSVNAATATTAKVGRKKPSGERSPVRWVSLFMLQTLPFMDIREHVSSRPR